MFEELIDFQENMLKLGIPGNDCIVYQNGKEIYRYYCGYKDKNQTQKLTGSEKYQIFSCSKLITCCAALQLWEKGMFKLDDPLYFYLPEYEHMYVKQPDNSIKKAQNHITIRHLFAMTAGFNYNLYAKSILEVFDQTNGSCPTRLVIKALAKEPLEFEPGTKWQYSLAHDVLASLVEVLSGMLFNDYVTENIFLPLKMKDSTFTLPFSQYNSLVPLYKERQDDSKLIDLLGMFNSGSPSYRIGPNYASGGASCVSTVEDYNKFLQAICSGELLLKRSTIEMLKVDQLSSEQRKNCMAGVDYSWGLGVRCPKAGDTSITDFGWGGAGGAYYSIDLTRNVTILYMQSVLTSSAAPMRMKIRDIVQSQVDKLKK